MKAIPVPVPYTVWIIHDYQKLGLLDLCSCFDDFKINII